MEEQFRPKERVGGSSPSRGTYRETITTGVVEMKAWVAYPIALGGPGQSRTGQEIGDFFLAGGEIAKQFAIFGLPHSEPAKTFELSELVGRIRQDAEISRAVRYSIGRDVDVLFLEYRFVSGSDLALDKLRRPNSRVIKTLTEKVGIELDGELTRYAVCLIDDPDSGLVASGTQVHVMLEETNGYVASAIAPRMAVAVAIERQLIDRATLELQRGRLTPKKARKALNRLLAWHAFPALDSEKLQSKYQSMRHAMSLEERSHQVQLNLRLLLEQRNTSLLSGLTVYALFIALASIDLSVSSLRPWAPIALLAIGAISGSVLMRILNRK